MKIFRVFFSLCKDDATQRRDCVARPVRFSVGPPRSTAVTNNIISLLLLRGFFYNRPVKKCRHRSETQSYTGGGGVLFSFRFVTSHVVASRHVTSAENPTRTRARSKFSLNAISSK